MEKLWIDFESYSEMPIRVTGRKKYIYHPSTMILCLGYAFDDEPAQLWLPTMPIPGRIIGHVSYGRPVYAHNAQFDWSLWNVKGCSDFGWPVLSLDQMVDTAAICRTYTLPGKLKDVGAVLKIKMQKDADGNRLIKICCTPDKNGKQPMPFDPVYKATFAQLYNYCVRDVEAMREAVKKLPRDHLIPQEQRIWKMTAMMNEEGLPIDMPAVKAILTYLSKYVKIEMKQVPKLCDYAFQKITQVAKVVAWCNTQGYPMKNLQAETVEKALKNPKIPPLVKRVLELRQELGRTSTAKFKKIMDQAYESQVFDNLIFHGAAPGRWKGSGFQMHNLPRAKVDNPEETIKAFLANLPIEDPVGKGKALIRAIIKAFPGWKLIVSDYSSIENRLLAWYAEDIATLQRFREGFDQYKDMASHRYHVPYDQVSKAQRQMGKQIILGCGYGMGGKKFKLTCEKDNILISEEEAFAAVGAYREKYKLNVDLWKNLKLMMYRVVYGGGTQECGRLRAGMATVNGTKWLAMRFPSGKSIYYMEPHLEDRYVKGYEHMGTTPTIVHWGINSYTKKWDTLALIPGRITENAVQGTAREVMAHGLLNVQARMPEVKLIGSVHDEAIGLIKDEDITDKTLDTFNNCLCDIPWLDDCPLGAEGYIAERYRKE